MEPDERKTYTIGGRPFWAAPPVARQQKWLWPILKPVLLAGTAPEPGTGQMPSNEGEVLLDMLFEQGEKLAAILLIPDGQTQEEKVRAGAGAVFELEQWLGTACTVADLAPVVRDFLSSGGLVRMAAGLCGLTPPSPTTGSIRPSAGLPMGTS